jgi:hypothetical protein
MPGPAPLAGDDKAGEDRTVPDDSRPRAKGGTQKAKTGTQRTKAGARNAGAGSQRAKGGTQNVPGGTGKAKGGTQKAKGGTQNSKATARNAQAGTRNAQAGAQGPRPWFGPKGLGMGYRPQRWQGYLVMLALGAYAIFIGTLSADHHTPLILLAIAPAAAVPRIITMIQQR